MYDRAEDAAGARAGGFMAAGGEANAYGFMAEGGKANAFSFGTPAQMVLRGRVLGNIAQSRAARAASRFDAWAFTYDPLFDSGNAASVAFQMRLPESMYPGTAARYHFREANRALLQAMDGDATFAAGMDQSIPGVRNQLVLLRSISVKPPRGWTWHHAVRTGVMELVPSRQHWGQQWRILHPDGRGGMSIWGGGYE